MNCSTMKSDDLITALRFLNRRQLLQFLPVNRLTRAIVENCFAKSPPFIYAELSIYKGIWNSSPGNAEFCLHLTALNCDCEQRLSIDSTNFYTYKSKMTECKCEMGETIIPEFHNRENWELEWHKGCNDWTPMSNPLAQIDPLRQHVGDVSDFLNDYKQHQPDAMCYTILEHKVHDELTRTWICNDYKAAHRIQSYREFRDDCRCRAVELLTNDVNAVVDHLTPEYVRLYKLNLQTTTSPDWGANKYEIREYQMFLQILRWIIANRKILASATFVSVDLHFLFVLFNRLELPRDDCECLLAFIGTCGKLQIAPTIYGNGGKYVNIAELLLDWLPNNNDPNILLASSNKYLYTKLLQNASMIDLRHIKFSTPEKIMEFLHVYNQQQNDPHRLVVFRDYDHQFFENIVKILIEDFTNSTSGCTYFTMIYGCLQRNEFLSTYYNSTLDEYLKLMPAYRYSINWKDAVPIYLARCSAMHFDEFGAFFAHLELNVKTIARECEERLQRENRTIARENHYAWAILALGFCYPPRFNDPPPEQMIYSFASFLAKIFRNDAKGGDDGKDVELFNDGERATYFPRFPLPPPC